jgi:thioredoxin-like negative regulator of GroEL
MATSTNIYQVESSDQFQQLLSADLERVSLLYFWTEWAAPCEQMTRVVAELSKKYPKLLFLQIQAETQSEISESFNIESVPTFVLLRVRPSRVFASSF